LHTYHGKRANKHSGENQNLERKQKVTKTKKSMIITITFVGTTVGPAVGLRLGLEVVGGTLTKKKWFLILEKFFVDSGGAKKRTDNMMQSK
jgi:hypothetical protein